MMLWLRSLLFSAGMILSLLLFMPVIPLLYPFDYQKRYAVLTRWGRFILWWLRVTCRLDYLVEGEAHIPAGPAVILAKHQSAWETIALQRIFPPQTWIVKRELLWIPVFGWSLAMLQSIAIDRSAGRKALQQVLEQGRERLRRGIWVVIFPEGTRTRPGAPGKYNIGGAMLAKKSGYPVVPVAHNAGLFWPRQGFLKRPGTIEVRVGPPIDPTGKSAGEINTAVEQWIEGEMAKLPGPERAPN